MHTHIELNRYAVCLKLTHYKSTLGFPGDSVVKNPTANAGDARDITSPKPNPNLKRNTNTKPNPNPKTIPNPNPNLKPKP